MSVNSPPIEFLLLNGLRLPFFLLYIVGLVLALTTWRRHPQASLLSLIAFVLFFFANAISAGMNWYVLSLRSGMAAGIWLTIANFVSMIITVVAWTLILFALFGRRPPQHHWPADDRYSRQYPERDVPAGPSSQEIRK